MNPVIEKTFRLRTRTVGGRVCRVFEENHDYLSAIFECFEHHADREFMVVGDLRLTYEETAHRAARLAGHLQSEFHIGPGSRVAIALPNSAEWILSFIALASLGAVPVLLNARAAEDETAYCLDATDCVLWLRGGAGPGFGPPSFSRDDINLLASTGGAGALARTPRGADDEAMLMFTSGTTGRPRAAILTHLGVLTALKTMQFSAALIAEQMARQYAVDYETIVRMRPPPVTLLVFPLFHVSGCHAVLLSGLLQGGKLVLLPRWDPEEALRLIERERVTALPGVPTMHRDLLRLPNREAFDLSSITTMSVGGQATPPALLEALHDAFPAAVPGSGYGMTEANGTVTLAVGDDFLANPNAAGKLVATVDAEIRDEDGNRLARGQTGEVFIRGASLMAGYANDDAGAFDEQGWFATGDLGYFDAGDNLYIVDRRTDMVISGGENIYCAEVERALDRHPAVLESVAFGQADERLGERLIALVVPVPGAEVTAEALLTACGSHLAKHKLPREIHLRHSPLPRNATGKIIKRRVRAEFEAAHPVRG